MTDLSEQLPERQRTLDATPTNKNDDDDERNIYVSCPADEAPRAGRIMGAYDLGPPRRPTSLSEKGAPAPKSKEVACRYKDRECL